MTADFIGEPLAGTCGVGTCISTGQTLTMHQGDHFDAPHILPTCTTSKMFDGRGRLNAVLDISALRSPHSKEASTWRCRWSRFMTSTLKAPASCANSATTG